MIRLLFIILFVGMAFNSRAQKVEKLIAQGNAAYKLQQYDKATAAYKEALQLDPKNNTAAFNLGNALFKDKKYQEAGLQFDGLARQTTDKQLQAKSLYNKGVANTEQKKLEESIEAYKQSLRLNSTDSFTRENLQRALNEKKQQQQQQQPQNDQQQKKQDQQQQPKPKPNKLNQQQVQQLLKALEEQEKKLQEKVMKKPPVPGQPDKDW